MTAYHVIEFPLKKGLPPQKIDFLPYSTRTLKIRVTNPDRVPDRLVLRSEHIPAGFGKSEFFSHEDGGNDFQASWGGGHEQGACVSGQDMIKEIAGKSIEVPFEECGPLLSRPESFVYINITHLKGPFDQPRPMQLSIRPENAPASAPMFSLPLELVPPRAADPVRLAKLDDSRFEFQGADVPDYLSRWWSPWKVSYSEGIPTPPRIQITRGSETLAISLVKDGVAHPLVNYQDRVQLQDLGQGHTIAADLYHFTGQYFVVRLWFFWLWKIGAKSWGHEIPDAERFDFVVDTGENRVVYGATDTHWRESWAPGPENGEPVRAQIGLFAPEIMGKMPWSERRNQEMFMDWMSKHRAKPEEPGAAPHIPADVVRKELQPALFRPAVLAVGPEAHVPYFVNCPPPKSAAFVGSDPRNG